MAAIDDDADDNNDDDDDEVVVDDLLLITFVYKLLSLSQNADVVGGHVFGAISRIVSTSLLHADNTFSTSLSKFIFAVPGVNNVF